MKQWRLKSWATHDATDASISTRVSCRVSIHQARCPSDPLVRRSCLTHVTPHVARRRWPGVHAPCEAWRRATCDRSRVYHIISLVGCISFLFFFLKKCWCISLQIKALRASGVCQLNDDGDSSSSLIVITLALLACLLLVQSLYICLYAHSRSVYS